MTMRRWTKFVGKQDTDFTMLAYLQDEDSENPEMGESEFIEWAESLQTGQETKINDLIEQNFRVTPTSVRPHKDYRQVSCSSCLKHIPFDKPYIVVASDFKSSNFCEECFKNMNSSEVAQTVQD